MSEDLKWVLVLGVLVLGMAVLQNYLVSAKGGTSLGLMHVNESCRGARTVNDFCVGVKQLDAEGISPRNATDKQMLEVKFAIQAQYFCEKKNLEGYEWKEHASYMNYTFQEWKVLYPELKSLPCEKTIGFPFENQEK